jgi:hypothetical protein
MRKGKISLKQLKKDLKKLTSGKRNHRSQFGEGCDGLDGMYTREGDSWAHLMPCYEYYNTYGVYPKSEKPVSARPMSARPMSARPQVTTCPTFNDTQLDVLKDCSNKKDWIKLMQIYHTDKAKPECKEQLNTYAQLINAKWDEVCKK